MRLGFTVQGVSMCADLLVSDEVDEITLGIDWFTENVCKWNFAKGQVEIQDRKVPFRRKAMSSRVVTTPGRHDPGTCS